MKPLTLPEIREMGFEPTPRGWLPRTPEARRAIEEADKRRLGGKRSTLPPWPDRTEECFICGWPAEASLVGTPTCSRECLAIAAEQDMPEIPVQGLPGKEPPKPFNWRLHRILSRKGKVSLELAKERIGTARDVLERHGVKTSGRMAFCPFHENSRTPAMSLYADMKRAKCHACGWSGDALDLEAGLRGISVGEAIRELGV